MKNRRKIEHLLSRKQKIKRVGLSPFFRYFGGKWRIALEYPRPKYDIIFEPFAGAAGYSTRYHTKQVVLSDINPRVYGVWKYIIETSKADILKLPTVIPDVIDELEKVGVPQEARWLIGWWCHTGQSEPSKTTGVSWMKAALTKTMLPGQTKIRPGEADNWWGSIARSRIANQSEAIKHWIISDLSYKDLPSDIEATWFVDPPYYRSGKSYTYNRIDYKHLGEWCRNRKGQVIVCEQEGADWLPFRPFKTVRTLGDGNGITKEVIWTNDD
jgi:hypothetical protein